MEAISEFIAENNWVIEVFLIVFVTAAVRLIAKYLFDRLARSLRETHNVYDDAVVDAARRPIGIAIWVVGISFAAEAVGGDAIQAEVFNYVPTIRDVSIIWCLIWFALNFIKFVEEHITDHGYGDKEVDITTVRAVGKLLRASVLITGVLLVLQAFGISIAGVLAFGGVGGIAVGFAARDMLANFFGALMVFMDRPFAVGDWVRSPDREIEGTVEEIGWRLTQIRTFDKRPLYVPNSVFTSIIVENPSRMLNRRIYETIGIRYADIDTMQAITDGVKAMLKSHEAIDTEQTLMVNFVAFDDSSLNFFVYCFTKTTVWIEFHAIKQDVLLRIAAIIDQHGAQVAFPTRTLHMEAEPEAEPEGQDPTERPQSGTDARAEFKETSGA